MKYRPREDCPYCGGSGYRTKVSVIPSAFGGYYEDIDYEICIVCNGSGFKVEEDKNKKKDNRNDYRRKG